MLVGPGGTMLPNLESRRLLEIVIRASQAAAQVVRKITSMKSYRCPNDGLGDAGVDDYHRAPPLDQAAQAAIEGVIRPVNSDCLIISEESLPSHSAISEFKGDLCFVVDPLDGSAFAKRRIPLASSSVCAYSLKEGSPIASAVTDVFIGKTYYAARHTDGAWAVLGRDRVRIFTSGCSCLRLSACSAFGTHPDRLSALVEQREFVRRVGWLLNSGGALDICRVAAGDLDASVEFAKGFRIWDIAAAAHILHTAGGEFGTPDHSQIPLTQEPRTRSCFIAAATAELFDEITRCITWRAGAAQPGPSNKARGVREPGS